MKEAIYENLDIFISDTVGCSGYWFPLAELTVDIPVLAYNIDKFFDEQPGLLAAVMRECGIETVTEVDYEAGPESFFDGQNIFALLNEQYEYEVFDLRFWRPRRREIRYTFPCHTEAFYFDESKIEFQQIVGCGQFHPLRNLLRRAGRKSRHRRACQQHRSSQYNA